MEVCVCKRERERENAEVRERGEPVASFSATQMWLIKINDISCEQKIRINRSPFQILIADEV